MRDLSYHETRDRPVPTRQAIEDLLGRPLSDDEHITILASRSHSAPTGEARELAWQKLHAHMDEMAKSVQGNVEELEKIVDEECDEVRHGPR
jgi:hypothetical protein